MGLTLSRLYRLTKNNLYIATGLGILSTAVLGIGFSAGLKMWTFDL